jgi:hypothetical protein
MQAAISDWGSAMMPSRAAAMAQANKSRVARAAENAGTFDDKGAQLRPANERHDSEGG